MKKMNKTTALILTCIMLVSSCVTAFAEEIKEPDGVTVSKLVSFGILTEDDDLIYEDTISRGTFIIYAAKLLGEFSAPEKKNPYSDVTEDDAWFEAAITLCSLGYIGGEQGSMFRPNDSIKTAEAAKILLGVLGYSEVAAKKPYPAGCLSVASRLGILNSLKGDTIEAYEMTELLFKTLNVKVLDVELIKDYDPDSIVYYTNDETKTLLQQNFSIYETEGIVEDNERTSIYGKDMTGKGYVTIAGESYKKGETEADDLIGQYVNAYYCDKNDERRLIYAAPDEKKNKILKIRSEDISADSITATEFEYWDEKKEHFEIAETERALVLIYNGMQTAYSKSFLTGENAEITLIDNDGDDRAEIISVMQYRTVVVSSVGNDFVITDELGGTNITLDTTAGDYELYIKGEKGELSPSDISAGDVLSYAQPLGDNPKIKYVLVSKERVSGTIVQLKEDEIQIDDVFYKTDKSCSETSVIGWNGEFYLDYFGKIVYKTVSRDMVYGYLNTISKKNFSVKARIFTENDRWVTLDFADKFAFGDKRVEAQKFYDEYGSSTENYRQLVRYRVNENAEIVEMDFAVKTEPWTEEELYYIDHDIFRLSAESASEKYRATLISLGGSILIKNSTKIFMIPNQSAETVAEEEEFYILSPGDLIGDRTYNNIKVYDSDSLGQAGVCVMTGNTQGTSSTNFFVITEVNSGITDDGEETYRLRGMYSGAEISLRTKNKEIVSDIGGVTKGDIYLVGFDSDGYVVRLERVFDAKGGFKQKFAPGTVYANNVELGGEIVRIDTGIQKMVLDYGSRGIFSVSSLSNIILYHTENGKLEKISAKDLQKGDYIVGLSAYYRFTQAVVFRP